MNTDNSARFPGTTQPDMESAAGLPGDVGGPSTLVWTLVALIVGAILLSVQARAVEGPAGLLQVGEASPLRPLIEAELSRVPLAGGQGHDGQVYFAMALDPDGDVVGPLLDHEGYRYRRILYPLAASAGGLLNGAPLLYGMVTVSLAGFVLATASAAALARSLGVSTYAALGVVLNPGVWLSLWTLTADGLAIGLAVTGLALFVRRPLWAAAAFGAAALGKEVFVVVGLAAAISLLLNGRRREALTLGVGSVVPITAWAGWLSLASSGGFSPRSNFGLPLQGVASSLPGWSGVEAVMAWTAIVLVVAAVIVVIWARHRLVHLLVWPWVLLAVTASDWVWAFGNNALRSFAFLGIPTAIGIVVVAGRPREQS